MGLTITGGTQKSNGAIIDRVNELAERLNTLANSDDESLDQLSEIVAYIKNNKDLIDAIMDNDQWHEE